MPLPDLDAFPVLHTPRLVLREHRPGDEDMLYRIRSDERSMQYIGRPRATVREDASELMERMRRGWEDKESLSWAVALREGDIMVGGIGLYRLKPEHHCAEVGYQLHPDHWGRGLMREALEAVIACTLGPLGFHRIEAITDPDNTRSRALLERCGFLLEGILRENYFWEGRYFDSAVYARLRSIPTGGAAAAGSVV